MIMTNVVSKGLLAAIAASALALVAAFLLVSSASAASATVSASADPASIEPGGSTTVTISVTPEGSETVGGVVYNVTYDEAELTATGCTPAATCNTAFAAGKVGVSLFNAGGLSGDVGTVTFDAVDGFTGTADVGVEIVGDDDCSDTLGATIVCTTTGTSITVGAAPTAAPTATPADLPDTGGTPGASSTSYLAWLLAATGMAVVAGGAWALASARREN